MKSFTKQLIATQPHPVVIDWYRRVRAAGGDINNRSFNAVNKFYVDLLNVPFFWKIQAVNCVVPDGLAAAATPLIKGTGFNTWQYVGVGGVDGVLTINGYQGHNGSSNRGMNTNISPAAIFTPTSSGMTVYVSNNVGHTSIETCGCRDASDPPRMTLYSAWTGETPVGALCYVNDIAHSINWKPTGGTNARPGYYSANRTALNNLTLYFAGTYDNTNVTHSGVQTATGNNASTPPTNVFVFSGYNFNGNMYGGDQWCSFHALHFGLTADESATFYTLIHRMRKAIGGGYVEVSS